MERKEWKGRREREGVRGQECKERLGRERKGLESKKWKERSGRE